MRNRYGEVITFDCKGDHYVMKGGTYLRFGGIEGEETINYNNLGFVDPSGGPFIAVGTMLPDVHKVVARIYLDKSNICFEVEENEG
jgi:hypothetical protein